MGLVTVLALSLLDALDRVLPAGAAARVGHNSEGYLLALVLVAWIHLVRPRLRGTRPEPAVTMLAAAGSVLGAVLLLASDLPSHVRTSTRPCWPWRC